VGLPADGQPTGAGQELGVSVQGGHPAGGGVLVRVLVDDVGPQRGDDDGLVQVFFRPGGGVAAACLAGAVCAVDAELPADEIGADYVESEVTSSRPGYRSDYSVPSARPCELSVAEAVTRNCVWSAAA
jgi:hypothetical protein